MRSNSFDFNDVAQMTESTSAKIEQLFCNNMSSISIFGLYQPVLLWSSFGMRHSVL